MLDAGRVVALDTPAGLIARTGERTFEDAYLALIDDPFEREVAS